MGKTKEEIEEEINETLGTNIGWSELKKDDLETFKKCIDENVFLEDLIRKMAKDKGHEKLDDFVDEWRLGSLARKLGAI